MSALHEVAFGLALTACTLGAIVSQIVLVSARRSGVYRSTLSRRTLLASRDSDAFFVVLQSWVSRVHLFVVGAFATAITWVIMAVIER